MSQESPQEHEAAQHPPYQGEFGAAELMQYPVDAATVQLAQSYTEPGTAFDWEASGYTAASGRDPADGPRQVILVDSQNNFYYLDGDRLFDVTATSTQQNPVAQRFDNKNPMPNITLGEPTMLFGKPVEFKKVIVKTEQAAPQDTAKLQVTTDFENPFDAMGKATEQQLKSAADRAKKERDEAAQAKRKEDAQKERDERIANARERAAKVYRGAAPDTLVEKQGPGHRSSIQFDPHRRGHVVNYQPGQGSMEEALGAITGHTSLHGTEMSPGFNLPKSIGKEEMEAIHAEYKKAYDTTLAATNSETMAARVAKQAVNNHVHSKYASSPKEAINGHSEHHRNGIWDYTPRKDGRLIRRVPLLGRLYRKIFDEKTSKRHPHLHTSKHHNRGTH